MNTICPIYGGAVNMRQGIKFMNSTKRNFMLGTWSSSAQQTSTPDWLILVPGFGYSRLLNNPSAGNDYPSGPDSDPLLARFHSGIRPQRCPKTCRPRLRRGRHVSGHLCGWIPERKQAKSWSESVHEGQLFPAKGLLSNA